jgi:hypothetical protein
MGDFLVSGLGRVAFEPNPEGRWDVQLPSASGGLRVDFNVRGSEMTQALLDRVTHFVAERERFDRIARAAILADHAEDPDFIPGREYLAHHVEEFSPEERRRYFGAAAPQAIGLTQLLAALQLVRIGLYPESEDAVAVFDYTIDRRATDYLLVANFNAAGKLLDIDMES